MSEVQDAPPVAQPSRDPWHRNTVAWSIAVVIAVVTLLSLNNSTARATALTQVARATFIKSAEESCFDGQSKQKANSRESRNNFTGSVTAWPKS